MHKHLLVFPTRDDVNTFVQHLGVLWPVPVAALRLVNVHQKFLLIYKTGRRLSIYEQRSIPAMETLLNASFDIDQSRPVVAARSNKILTNWKG